MTLTGEQLELPYFIPTSENVRQLITALNEPPEQDEDFHLFRNRTARPPWRWAGTGRYVGQRSARNFATAAQAIEHAQTTLSKA